MPDIRFLHASLLVADLAASRDFYEAIIGLRPLPRPELGFPGAWYDLGNAQLHLLRLDNPDPIAGRPAHGGRDRHIALAVSDWDGLGARLDARAIAYTLSQSGRRALFCRDPDGNTLELAPLD
jgi:glyoxylase I family protein